MGRRSNRAFSSPYDTPAAVIEGGVHNRVLDVCVILVDSCVKAPPNCAACLSFIHYKNCHIFIQIIGKLEVPWQPWEHFLHLGEVFMPPILCPYDYIDLPRLVVILIYYLSLSLSQPQQESGNIFLPCNVQFIRLKIRANLSFNSLRPIGSKTTHCREEKKYFSIFCHFLLFMHS